MDIELSDEEKVRALFSALELDPDRHVATFSVEEDPLRSRARWLAARSLIGAGGLALILGVLGIARRNELLLLAVVPVLLMYALVLPRARVRTDVVLGADGLTLCHRGRVRSIPLSAISEVRSAKNVVTLVLQDGEELVLRFGGDDDGEGSVQHAAFTLRMRQMPEETLWRIAEGTVAEPTARVGALVALRARFDDGARQRLHELAERTAQRDLRAALEAAAEGAEADEIIAAYDRASRS